MVKHRETSVWVEVDGHVLPEVHMKGFVSRLDGTYRVSGFIPSQAGKVCDGVLAPRTLPAELDFFSRAFW